MARSARADGRVGLCLIGCLRILRLDYKGPGTDSGRCPEYRSGRQPVCGASAGSRGIPSASIFGAIWRSRSATEVLVALDGPLLPTPSWKIVFEVNDAPKLENTIQLAVTNLNRELEVRQLPTWSLESETVDGKTYYALTSAGAPVEIHYTSWMGYMIFAPSRALVAEAIRIHDSGSSINRLRGVSLAIASGWTRYRIGDHVPEPGRHGEQRPRCGVGPRQPGRARQPAHRNVVRESRCRKSFSSTGNRIEFWHRRKGRSESASQACWACRTWQVRRAFGSNCTEGPSSSARRGGCASKKKCEAPKRQTVVVQVQEHFRLILTTTPSAPSKEASRYFS